MKYKKGLAGLLAVCGLVLAGCSEEQAPKRPLQSIPVVVASDNTSSVLEQLGHSHNCSDPNTLCGTITNQVFQDTQNTFRIQVPEGWSIQEQELSRDSMILGSPTDHATMEIRRQESDPNLLAYTQAEFEQSYQTDVTDFQMLTFEQTSIQNHRAVHLVYTCSDAGVSYQFYQYILAGDFDYNISYIRRRDEPDLSASFLQSIQSFQELSPRTDPQSNQGRLVGTRYTSGDGSYSLSLPEGWRIDPTQDHIQANSADHTAALTILVGEPDATLVDTKQEQMQQQYSQRFPDTKISLFEKTTLGGHPALHLVCTYHASGKEVCAEQYVVCSPQHTYHLVYTKAGTATDPSFEVSAKTLQAG